MKTILFVCSGNYCRSPLAEGLARLRLQQADDNGQFLARSAGTRPEYEGQPRAPLVLEVLHEIGADGPANRPHQITPDEIEQAAVIFGAAHLNNPPNVGYYFILATLAGIFYGRTFVRTGKVVPTAIVHLAVDWMWSVVFAG